MKDREADLNKFSDIPCSLMESFNSIEISSLLRLMYQFNSKQSLTETSKKFKKVNPKIYMEEKRAKITWKILKNKMSSWALSNTMIYHKAIAHK